VQTDALEPAGEIGVLDEQLDQMPGHRRHRTSRRRR
jgi:hypothetical protein